MSHYAEWQYLIIKDKLAYSIIIIIILWPQKVGLYIDLGGATGELGEKLNLFNIKLMW